MTCEQPMKLNMLKNTFFLVRLRIWNGLLRNKVEDNEVIKSLSLLTFKNKLTLYLNTYKQSHNLTIIKNPMSPSNFPLCPSFFFAGESCCEIIIAGNKVEQLHGQDEVQCYVSPPFSSTAGGLTENQISCLGNQSSYQNLWDQNLPPSPLPKRFRASGKIQVIAAQEPKMKRILVIWEEGFVCTCICVWKDVYSNASNVVHVEKMIWNAGQVLN